ELAAPQRSVEVVLETLPLGLYVLDRDLAVLSATRESDSVLPRTPTERAPFLDLVPPAQATTLRELLGTVLDEGLVRQTEEEATSGSEARVFRFTAAPLRGPDGPFTHHKPAA